MNYLATPCRQRCWHDMWRETKSELSREVLCARMEVYAYISQYSDIDFWSTQGVLWWLQCGVWKVGCAVLDKCASSIEHEAVAWALTKSICIFCIEIETTRAIWGHIHGRSEWMWMEGPFVAESGFYVDRFCPMLLCFSTCSMDFIYILSLKRDTTSGLGTS